jgi:hypothetical protein
MNNGSPLEKVNIYNITGSPVNSLGNIGNRLVLPTASLQAGIYIVRILSGNNVYTKKVIFK